MKMSLYLLFILSIVITTSAAESRLGKCKDKKVVAGPVQNFDIEKFLGIWVVTMKKETYNSDHLCKIENWYKKREEVIMEEIYYEKGRNNLKTKKYLVVPDGKFNGKFILYSSEDGKKETREIWLHDKLYQSWAVEYECTSKKDNKGENIHSEHLWVLAKWKDANIYDLMDVRYWFRYTKYSYELLPMALDLKMVTCPFNDSGYMEDLPSRPKDLVTDKQIKEISDKYWDDVIAEKTTSDDFINMGLAKFEQKIIEDAAKSHDGFREHPDSYFTYFKPAQYKEPVATATEQAEGFIQARKMEKVLEKKNEKEKELKKKVEKIEKLEEKKETTTTTASVGNDNMLNLL